MTESAVQNNASAAMTGPASAPAGLPLRWVVILALAGVATWIALVCGAPVWTAITLLVTVIAGAHKVIDR